MQRYSFDDYSIGRINDTGSSLVLDLIARPKGISRDDWYKHAKQVVELLNYVAQKGSANE